MLRGGFGEVRLGPRGRLPDTAVQPQPTFRKSLGARNRALEPTLPKARAQPHRKTKEIKPQLWGDRGRGGYEPSARHTGVPWSAHAGRPAQRAGRRRRLSPVFVQPVSGHRTLSMHCGPGAASCLALLAATAGLSGSTRATARLPPREEINLRSQVRPGGWQAPRPCLQGSCE